MVEDPPGDASGGLLRHVHAHGCVAGLHIEADEPAAREPVDFQQVVVTPGPAVFAPVVHRPFAQMPGQARVGENAATRLLACRIIQGLIPGLLVVRPVVADYEDHPAEAREHPVFAGPGQRGRQAFRAGAGGPFP